MRVALFCLLGLLIAAHLGFFCLEAIAWKWEDVAKIRKDLRFTGDQTDVARVGVNQGLSNAFLAFGLSYGLWALHRGRPAARPILYLFLGFIVVAGIVGYLSIDPGPIGTVAFLVGQTGLALAALVCLTSLRQE
jgi:uncharacterized membrane protein